MLVQSDGLSPIAMGRRGDTQLTRVTVYAALAFVDLLIVLAGFAVSDFVRHGRFVDSLSIGYFLIAPVFTAVSFYARAYAYHNVVSRRRSITQAFTSMLAAVAITVVISFALKSSEDVSRIAFFTGSLLSLIGLTMARLPLPALIRHLGPRFMRRILIVDGPYADSIPDAFERIDAGALNIRPELDDPVMLHRFSQLVHGADRVVVVCPVERRANWSLYLKSVDCAGELLMPELHGLDPLGHDGAVGLIGVRVSAGKLDIRNRLLKRGFDLALTVPAVIALSPVMLVVAVAIALESRGPILFRQQRMGRANQFFNVLKFRSMYVDRLDHNGLRSTGRGDDRITRVGRIIRATSLDELPQLFNVISGDMSLVGPRPHALGSRAGDELFWRIDQRYWLRHTIKPGLTGLAQVRGYRGATDDRVDLTKRLESDIEYLADWSLVNDALILFRTVFVLVHRNAY